MSLLEFLDDLGCQVDMEIDSINFGGCAVYAAFITKQLKNRGIRANGIVTSYHAKKSCSIAKARNYVPQKANCDDWDDNHISLDHVAVEFVYKGERFHYDSRGVLPAKKLFHGMPIYSGRLKVEELDALAESKVGWNRAFDRTQIPKLKKIINKAFAERCPV